jgi:hypothetical protein
LLPWFRHFCRQVLMLDRCCGVTQTSARVHAEPGIRFLVLQEGAAVERPSKRPKLYQYSGPEPSVEEIEAEFWRIVEKPDDVVESFYGQACNPCLLLYCIVVQSKRLLVGLCVAMF